MYLVATTEKFKFFARNFIKICKIFIKAKLTIYKPKKTDILIVDKRDGVEAVELFFHQYDYEYLYTRREEINIYVLIITLLRNGYKELHNNYLKCMIDLRNPKIVFCLHENNWNLYKLPNKKYKYKLIIWQLAVIYANGWNFYYKKKYLKCDYLLTGSNHNKIFLNKVIHAEYLKAGSFKLNAYLGDVPEQGEQGICFISEYRDKGDYSKRKAIKHAYKIISDICSNHDIKLSVAFASSRKDKILSAQDEAEFYSQINSEFEFSNESSYLFAVKSNTVICLLSNLGLELVSLGYKVFFLDTHLFYDPKKGEGLADEERLISKNYYSYHFGDQGEFWDSGIEYEIMKTKILSIYNMNKPQWEKTYKKYKPPVEYFDPGNRTLSKIINNHL